MIIAQSDNSSEASTPGTLVKRDSYGNIYANNFIPETDFTIPNGGTTTLTKDSGQVQRIGGAVADHTFILPLHTDAGPSFNFWFFNESPGIVTIRRPNGAGFTTVTTLQTNQMSLVRCLSTTPFWRGSTFPINFSKTGAANFGTYYNQYGDVTAWSFPIIFEEIISGSGDRTYNAVENLPGIIYISGASDQVINLPDMTEHPYGKIVEVHRDETSIATVTLKDQSGNTVIAQSGYKIIIKIQLSSEADADGTWKISSIANSTSRANSLVCWDKDKNIHADAIALENGTTPSSTADTVFTTSSDLSAGNTTLALVTEGTPISNISPTSPNRTLAVKVNGTIYYLHCKTTNN